MGREVRLKATDEVLKETSPRSKTALVCPDKYGSDTDMWMHLVSMSHLEAFDAHDTGKGRSLSGIVM
jgi:hypothetical protein